MKDRQRIACGLAETARTTEELERAHRAMVDAFPSLASAYPCDCRACVLARMRKFVP